MGTISKLLGHANPTITQNIYVHWRDPQIRGAAMSVGIGNCKKTAKRQEIGVDDVSVAR